MAEEQCCIWAIGRDALAYFTRSTGKGRKKQNNGKKCTHYKHKGHNISECRTLKWEQEEKVSSLNSKSTNASISGKASSKTLSKNSSNRSSAKVTNVNADSNSDSNKMIQVFVAHAASDNEEVKHVYKTKAELH